MLLRLKSQPPTRKPTTFASSPREAEDIPFTKKDFGPFPAQFQVEYQVLIDNKPDALLLFADGTGKTLRANPPVQDKKFTMYWKIKDGKKLIITSNGIRGCQQQWDLRRINPHQVELLPEGTSMDGCGRAAGFLPVTPVGLIRAPAPDAVAEQAPFAISLPTDALTRGPFPMRYRVNYVKPARPAAYMTLHADGTGLLDLTRGRAHPPTNFQWKTAAFELTLTSQVIPACHQVWDLQADSSLLFNLRQVFRSGGDCGIAPGLVPATEVSLTRLPARTQSGRDGV
jgi:hypothetical protein